MSREFQRINGALAIKCGITMDNGFWKFAGLSRSEVIYLFFGCAAVGMCNYVFMTFHDSVK